MIEIVRPPLPAGYVRILSVKDMKDPWTGEQKVAVLYEEVSRSCLVMMTKERCAELRLRKVASEGWMIPKPHWRHMSGDPQHS
jgi:hypothetical protein